MIGLVVTDLVIVGDLMLYCKLVVLSYCVWTLHNNYLTSIPICNWLLLNCWKVVLKNLQSFESNQGKRSVAFDSGC